jgi:hypothetical protein
MRWPSFFVCSLALFGCDSAEELTCAAGSAVQNGVCTPLNEIARVKMANAVGPGICANTYATDVTKPGPS